MFVAVIIEDHVCILVLEDVSNVATVMTSPVKIGRCLSVWMLRTYFIMGDGERNSAVPYDESCATQVLYGQLVVNIVGTPNVDLFSSVWLP